MKTLLIGGSGFVGRAMARVAQVAGHEVTVVGRGQRTAPPGVRMLAVDRRRPGELARVLRELGERWDLVVDCAGYQAEDAEQDLELFCASAGHLVFLSSDAVFDTLPGLFPRDEKAGYKSAGYGGDKRACELAFEQGDAGALRWTVLRPTHIYGPGSELGCLPWHLRDPGLLAHLREGKPLRLVAAGSILQQPIYVDDLARLALSCAGLASVHRGSYLAVGPEMVEAHHYYRLVAQALGVGLEVEETDMGSYIGAFPEMRSVLTHRAYGEQGPLLASVGLEAPATALAVGIGRHVRHLLALEGMA